MKKNILSISKAFLLLFIIVVFSACSVKSVDYMPSYKPIKNSADAEKGRAAVVSKLETSKDYVSKKGLRSVQTSIEDTLYSTGIYEKVLFGRDALKIKEYHVDEYRIDFEPEYTTDFSYWWSWPTIYPAVLVWPIQPYTAEIKSTLRMTAKINGKIYQKKWSSEDDTSVIFYGWYRTGPIEDKMASTMYKNLEEFKYYVESDLRFAINITTPVQNIAVEPTLDTPYISPFNFTKNDKVRPNDFALVIGISKYANNPDVAYADNSARSFKELSHTTFGIPKENIITLLNDEASSGQLKANIELIKELAESNGNIYIYFAGHGVPGKDGSVYMLPSDMSADTIHLEPNLKLDNIYAKFSKLDVKNVYVFMDSCFSGRDDSGQLLYKGVAPVLKTNKTVITDEKLTVFTAGKSTDFANDFESKQQRMFSYFLIKELSEGKKDLNTIYTKVKSKVKRASLLKGLGYKQIPQVYGSTEKELY